MPCSPEVAGSCASSACELDVRIVSSTHAITRARYNQDLEDGLEGDAPNGMGDAPLAEQEAHCIAEHGFAWELLRNNT